MSVKIHSDQDHQGSARVLSLPAPIDPSEPVRVSDLATTISAERYLAGSRVASWIARSAAEANEWWAIAWSPQLGLFAAISNDGTNRVMTSPDGITWTARSAAEANNWRSITWSPQLALFVAVSNSGTNRVMTSPDGITWTARAAAAANSWNGVTWSPQLGLLVAVAGSGTNRVMTSPDGITWTARSAAEANNWCGITWSPQLGLFAAVSIDGTNRVMTSPDGSTWTARAASAANNWNSITWSPQLGLFASAATAGTNRVMTSPDGITWTARTIDANEWRSITWSPQLGLFVAVSAGGTNRVATSPDGITWTARSAAAANAWYALEWSPQLGLFAAVSIDGTNRVMTSLPLTALGTPSLHATKHQSGGADPIKLDDLAAPDDNTDLNASPTAHGLLKKLSNVATEYLDGTGNFSTPGGGGDTIISPSQLTADTDDWNPTSLSTATVIRVDTDANLRFLSSIVAPGAAKRLRLENISANTLLIKDQAAALGTAANRIICGGQDLPLFPGDSMDLRYDSTSSRWRVVGPQARVIPPRRFGWYGVRPSFIATTGDPGVFNASSTVSGTSAANTGSGGDSNNVTRFILQSTGTDTTGRAHFGTDVGNFLLGNNWYWRFATRIKVVNLSDGTDTFTYRIGLNDSLSGDGTDGVFLRYTHSVNSGNFELVLRSNSSETAINCSAGPAADTWCDLSIVVTPTRVEAYKDGVLIGSTTTVTNLPTGASRVTGIAALIVKSAGTTARSAGLQSFELVGYKGVP